MTRIPSVIFVAIAAFAVQLASPADAHAQGRRGGRGGRVVVVARPYYSPYYSPWFYDPWYGAGFGFPYPPYGYGVYRRDASLRLQVEPRQTEVFVDGYYAGLADEFDGVFQRLRLEPGEHEVQLYLQGYRSVTERVYLQPDNTFRIRQTMVALAPGDPQEERPAPPATAPPPPDPSAQAPARRPPFAGGRPRGAMPQADAQSNFGAVALRVQPGDAEVLVDGERWEGTGTGTRLTIELPAGPHRIEVRKGGFETNTSVVQVRPGQVATLNISLTQE